MLLAKSTLFKGLYDQWQPNIVLNIIFYEIRKINLPDFQTKCRKLSGSRLSFIFKLDEC